VTGVVTSAAACTKDETDARNELAKRWSQYGASEKKACVGESSFFEYEQNGTVSEIVGF
jgi:hypothetical protein